MIATTWSQRFWKYVKRGNIDECWSWTAATNCRGYGKFTLDGRRQRANRLAYILGVGPIPDGLYVCHACDNPGCCNPAHLWVGTAKENIQDAVRKGRMKANGGSLPHHCGSSNPVAVLDEEKVLEIRSSDESNHELARRFGTNDSNISLIRLGKTWTHVGGRILKSNRGGKAREAVHDTLGFPLDWTPTMRY